MKHINLVLDQLLQPFTHHQPTWRLCVFTGMLLGISLAMGLAVAVNLSPWVAGGVAVVGVLICMLMALAKLVLTGVESYTFYHYQAGVLAATAVLLTLTHQPILAYLDLIALALAVALACGRWGCQAAGCCHGRPHKWGVCYRERPYQTLGFPSHLLGVRLFPVQLVESLWLWLIVFSGSWMVLADWPDGSVLAWYVVGYGCGRFFLEFWRGDEARPYFASFSTAQWTCLVWLGGTAVVEQSRILPLIPWHLVLIGGCFLMATGLLWPGFRSQRSLRSPSHVCELAHILALIPAPKPMLMVQCTSAGYQVSGEEVKGEATGVLAHYTLSHKTGSLSASLARQLAMMILHLRHSDSPGQIVSAQENIFHILIISRE